MSILSLVFEETRRYNIEIRNAIFGTAFTGNSPRFSAAMKGMVIEMEDMIKRIIEMDRQARQITEQAQSAKLNSTAAIEKKKQRLRDEYLAQARAQVEQNNETEQNAANRDWDQIQQRYSRRAQKLDEQFAANREKWVAQLFERTLS